MGKKGSVGFLIFLVQKRRSAFIKPQINLEWKKRKFSRNFQQRNPRKLPERIRLDENIQKLSTFVYLLKNHGNIT